MFSARRLSRFPYTQPRQRSPVGVKRRRLSDSATSVGFGQTIDFAFGNLFPAARDIQKGVRFFSIGKVLVKFGVSPPWKAVHSTHMVQLRFPRKKLDSAEASCRWPETLRRIFSVRPWRTPHFYE